MGTIADKLDYLTGTKDLFKDRLNSLGAEITSSTTFRNYLNWLDTFYEEVSDKTDISVNGVVGRTSQETTTGKNLFNKYGSFSYGGTNNKTSLNEQGQIVSTSNIYNMRSNGQLLNNLKPNTNYTVSGTLLSANGTATTNAYVTILHYNGTTSTNITNNPFLASLDKPYQFEFTFNTENYENIWISFNGMNSGTPGSTTTVFDNIQVEEGSTATSYEPFTNGPSPNPSYERPINNLSGDVSYKVSGKNLFNLTYEIETQYKTEGNVVPPKYILNNNQIEISQSNAQYGRYFFNKLLLDVGTYTLSWIPSLSGTNKRMNYSVRNLDTSNDIVVNTRIDIVDNEKYSITFTLNEKQYVTFSLQPATNDASTLTLKNIQLEENSTATSYEPYIEPQTFNIPLGDIELCDIDTYEDKIYSSNGRFYLHKETRKYNLFELSYSYNSSSTTPVDRTVLVTYNSSYEEGHKTTYFSNIFKSSLQNKSAIPNRIVTNSSSVGSWFLSLADNLTGIISSDDIATKVSKITTYLQSKNAVLITYLATPTTTEITQENYPSLYNALKQIQDYLTAYKINKEFILGYSSPEIEY